MNTNAVLDWGYSGNEWAVGLLQGQIVNGGLRHAYLFTGPPGIGRRTLALKLAQALLCENPPETGTFCGICRQCTQLISLQHPDLYLVEVQEGDRQIKIEAVRELNRILALAPYEADKQIALLLNFDQASRGAANALLKTLEEPSSSSLLLLTAESAESLPSTIASRCEVLRLRPLANNELTEELVGQEGVDKEEAGLAARFSSGRPGLALNLLRKEGALAERRAWLDELHEILKSDLGQRFAYAENFQRDRAGLNDRLRLWLMWWRERLIGSDSGAINGQDKNLSRGEIRRVIGQLQESLGALDGNANVRLSLESLLISLPKLD
jgi:DNA polymerase-3 subunit delta'